MPRSSVSDTALAVLGVLALAQLPARATTGPPEPITLAHVPMIWIEIDERGDRRVERREEQASYDDARPQLLEALVDPDFALELVAIDPAAVSTAQLRDLGQAPQGRVAEVLAELALAAQADGALCLWHESGALGVDTLVVVLYLPDRLEILGDVTASLNFERMRLATEDEFWTRVSEGLRRQLQRISGRPGSSQASLSTEDVLPTASAPAPPRDAAAPEPAVAAPEPTAADAAPAEAAPPPVADTTTASPSPSPPESASPEPPADAAPPPPPRSEASDRPDTGDLPYQVKPGETFSSIASRCYGDKRLAGDLAAYNAIPVHEELVDAVLSLPAQLLGRPLKGPKCAQR